MQSVRNTPTAYTIAPAARDVQLDDAHLRTPQRAPRSVHRRGLNTARVAITAGITLALEALRRTRTADAAGMMMVCENGGCYEIPDPLYQPPAQQQRPLDFSRTPLRPDVFAELNSILNAVAGGICQPACGMTKFQIHDVCRAAAAAGGGGAGALGALAHPLYGAVVGAGVGGATFHALCNQAYRDIKEKCFLQRCYTVHRGEF